MVINQQEENEVHIYIKKNREIPLLICWISKNFLNLITII